MPSTSLGQNVTVLATYAKAKILSCVFPSEAKSGGQINVTGVIQNIGEYGYLLVRLLDSAGNELDYAAFNSIDPLTTAEFNLDTVMPSSDYPLRIEAGHFEYVEPYDIWVVDDYRVSTVVYLLEVGTTLTLDYIGPKKAGAAYSYTGRLTRTGSNTGVATQLLICERDQGGSWIVVGNPTTDAQGNYSLASVAPSTQGIYPCRTRFPGTGGYFLSRDIYRPSVSATQNLTVGEAEPINMWLVLGALGLVALAYMSQKKR